MSQCTQILVELVLCPLTLTGGAFGSITLRLIFSEPSAPAESHRSEEMRNLSMPEIFVMTLEYARPPVRTVCQGAIM